MVTEIFSRDRFLEERASLGSLTVKKVQQVALYAIAVGALLTGIILLGEAIFLWTFTLAVPVSITALAVGVTTFLVARDRIDYEDKNQLDAYRQEMRNLIDLFEEEEKEFSERPQGPREIPEGFKQILNPCIQKHGFKNMFRYGIPHPRDFRRIWDFMARHMNFKEIMDFYTVIHAEYQKVRAAFPGESYPFEIPPPITFRDKWDDSNFCKKICEVFDMRELKEFEIISEAQYRLFRILKKDYLEAKQSYEKETADERKAVQVLIQDFQEWKERKCRVLEREFSQHPAHEALRELRLEKVKELRLLNRSMKLDPDLQRAYARKASMEKELVGSGRDEAIQMEEKHFKDVEAMVHHRFAPYRDRIESRFKNERSSHLAVLLIAEREFDKNISEIEQEYKGKVKRVQERFKEACHEPLARFKDIKNRLNARWLECAHAS